ncbi:sigma-70 family RNA polymerase sigma factor [Tropicibacter naphthalenivorans]|uniref:Sigma-K factor n=1 Tax=Tropicibacter naphthalenivorans TaxID=441103 RepID=A0A0P1GJL6_9RHOB|nr:sigma-70 family RNA polymerase sigma factor [Tropicibacter naphthalenivorans]CUH76146.1 Sigma-K factor [Tropicibacter naphthalenivorans]SMC39679.1 RNA polymerase sigma-70 factor, ECF subfamily [Tropicibacter naphthalenivorans]
MKPQHEQEQIEEWIVGIAMGDRRAFRALYAALSPRLFGLACHIVDDDGAAEEVLEAVFQRIWTRAGKYRAGGYGPLVWLLTITQQEAVHSLRARRAVGQAAPLDFDDTGAAGAAPSAEGQMLASCLRELPPDRAGMVQKAYLQGATYAELSAEMGVSEQQARPVLRRSLMQLRECLSR